MQRHPDTEFQQGDTWCIAGVLTEANGVPFVLNNATIQWELSSLDKKTVVLSFTTPTSAIQVTNANGGLITITVPSSNTVPISANAYYDELRVTRGNIVSTQWSGRIKVLPSLFA